MNQNESKEVWDQRIADYRKSHLSLAKWCEKNSIPVTTMKYYLYQFPKKKETVNFVPAEVIDVNPIVKESSITVSIGDVSVKVDSSTDLDLLSKIVKALS